MTTMARVNIATREAVVHLEHRFGRKRLYLAGGAILLALFVLFLRGLGTKPKTAMAPPPRPVDVATVSTRDVPLYLDEIGTCTAFETVQVQAQVGGQIIAREFKDGADVKKGDLLFRIDPRPYEAALASAQADLALHQSTLKRQETLRAQNVTASQEWDTAQANARKAEAAVKTAQVNLEYCYIKSPIDGRAGLRLVDVGNVVGGGNGGGGPVLVTIQGMDPIYTDFTVAEPDLPLVRRYLGRENLKVLTDAEDDDLPPREGELSFIDNSLQAGAGTVKARAVTPNSDRALWPSQFVHVRLILEMLKDAKLVPSSAVQIGQNGPYVFVVKNDSTLDLRQVKPGQAHGDLTVVTEGLKPGERVVVSGQLQLAPGAKVAVQQAKAAEGAKPSSKSLK
jgi:membrane fusion protein, multidrug efflux system